MTQIKSLLQQKLQNFQAAKARHISNPERLTETIEQELAYFKAGIELLNAAGADEAAGLASKVNKLLEVELQVVKQSVDLIEELESNPASE